VGLIAFAMRAFPSAPLSSYCDTSQKFGPGFVVRNHYATKQVWKKGNVAPTSKGRCFERVPEREGDRCQFQEETKNGSLAENVVSKVAGDTVAVTRGIPEGEFPT